MKKALAIVALVAAMFVAGNVQAQSTIYAGYAPEKFSQTVGNNTSTSEYQGFFIGFTKNFGLSKGFDVAAGAQFRMNTKSGDAFFGFGTGKSTQALIDVPILLNYDFSINRDITITPFDAVFGADVKFSQFNLFGGYRFGLLDLNSNDNITLKTKGLFVGLGYTL